MSSEEATLYFAYGSNLWLDQMARRCPGNTFIGIGVLRDWKWMINTRGVANVLRSPGDFVYGFVYSLTPEDEEKLDGFESAGKNYFKQIHHVERQDDCGSECLIYVDLKSVEPGAPRLEYIDRMNFAIRDSEQMGIPEHYIQHYLRPFIPSASVVDIKALY